ncbi:hypothetical protein HDU76_008536, partial [Blyttiomyces sp. JEL0837]
MWWSGWFHLYRRNRQQPQQSSSPITQQLTTTTSWSPRPPPEEFDPVPVYEPPAKVEVKDVVEEGGGGGGGGRLDTGLEDRRISEADGQATNLESVVVDG